jgi:hypothetical protein
MATGNRCTDQYRVERTKCGCHPETCCCPDFSLWSGNYLVARGSNESELRKLADAGNKGAAETKATLPHGFTGLQAFDAYEWLRGVCEKEPDNDHAHVALGLWHHHATGGPVETTVQPDEKCGNCGDDYSKHLGERLICPDAAMPDIYRWTAEPTQVKAGG